MSETRPVWLGGGHAVRPSRRRAGIILLVLCASLAASGVARTATPHLNIGDPPPALMWTSTSGDTLSWDTLRNGRPLVMVFWATWCAVCKKDWPKLKALADRYADAPLAPAWASVSLGEDAKKVAKVARQRELPGWIIVDPHETNGTALGIEYVPVVCVLDARGRLAYMGSPKIGKLDRLLDELTSSDKEAAK